ncbi:hypothetical protein ABZV75_19910, partial [Streptomyces flaveolus]
DSRATGLPASNHGRRNGLPTPSADRRERSRLELMETTGISFADFINHSGLPEFDVRTLLSRDISERPRVEF